MKTLFDETMINRMKIKNRIIRSATWENMIDESGKLNNELIKIYEDLAKGGVGLIITGTTYVTEDTKTLSGHMGINNDRFIKDYKKLTDIVHSHDCRIILQANYAGKDEQMLKPIELTQEEIKSIIKSFGDTAVRAEKAGFDGIQIHAAHGFFLSQFLSPEDNKRMDEYGGSLENNSRIILDLYNEIRERTGENFNIFVKINCIDSINYEKTFEACKYTCIQLSKKGIDGIEISGEINKKLSPYTESIFRDYATKIAEEVEVPIILVGLNRTPAIMNEILNKTEIQYFALSRPLIRQPELVNIWQEDINKMPKCISCNKCFKTVGNRCVFNL